MYCWLFGKFNFKFRILSYFHIISFFLLIPLNLLYHLSPIFKNLMFVLLLRTLMKIDIAGFILHNLVIELTEICLSFNLKFMLSVRVVTDNGSVFFVIFVYLINIEEKIDSFFLWGRMLRSFMTSFMCKDRTLFCIFFVTFFVLFFWNWANMFLILKFSYQKHSFLCFLIFFNGIFFLFFKFDFPFTTSFIEAFGRYKLILQ